MHAKIKIVDRATKDFACDEVYEHGFEVLEVLTLNVPIPDKKKKINNLNFHLTLLCGASKGFVKALKALKFKLIFISIQLSQMHRTGGF